MKSNNNIRNMETLNNKRIIVIDDDTDIWEAYRAILAPHQLSEEFTARRKMEELIADIGSRDLPGPESFDVAFASQGQDGFELVQRAIGEGNPFAVAFVDVRMPPGWDGMETAVQIRAVDPDVEIVIVTAYTDRSRDEIAQAVSPSHKLLYLRKPFDPDELKQIALSLCEKWNVTRSEERRRQELATILSTTPAAIFTTDMERNITSWNPAAESITGYAADEVVGKPCIFKKIALNPFCRECGLSNNGLGGLNKEITFPDRRGKERTISLNSTWLVDRNSEHVGLVESFWDISLRREAEKALQESEERYRSLVETTSDWVWEVDSEARFTYCSPVCETIYGYRPEELLGRSLLDVLIATESLEEFKGEFQQCFQKGCSFQGVERQVVRKDGEVIYVETSGAPLIENGGRITGFHGIDRDVTERKKMEAEKTIMEERYHQSQKLEALGTLAGGIAHDFNNILTPIIGYAQLGELNLKKGNLDKIQESLSIIRESASTAAELTKQILSYSRQQVLDTKRVDISTTVKGMSKMLSRLIREDIELVYDLEENIWFTRADSGRLGQVLINLVVNAKDAIVEAGRIVISTKNVHIDEADPLLDAGRNFFSGDFVLMSVGDTGMGMDRKTQDRIFDPFFTTKPSGKGTGIGLSTVFGIVRQHGGHIILESNPGQGTVIQIYLPRETDDRSIVEDKKKAEDLLHGSETILIVEDSKDVLAAISVGLQAFGYRVIEANGSDRAVELINRSNHGIDMLITDVVMPGLSGREVAEIFRIKHETLPVLFMSGHTSEIDPQALQKIKNSYFMQKPFSPTQIASRVRAIIDAGNDKRREN